MGPKIFTVRDANSLIPSIESVFVDLDKIRTRLKHLKNKVDVLEMLWGEEIQSDQNPDSREYQHYMAEIGKTKADYESATKRLAELEVMLKSIETGLVDFYGVVEGRLVFLCWKRGEKSVEFYHHLEDGFAGRLPIPAPELTK
jgi:hypothetical protein